MVIEEESNFVYFSQIFAKSFHSLFIKIIDILDKHYISYDVLYNTNDIWCNDFMPHQLDDVHFANYVSNPEYLQQTPHLKTHVNKVLMNLTLQRVNDFPLILEGSNIVRRKNMLIISEKIFKYNSKFYTSRQIFDLLHEYLLVDKIIVLPLQPLYNLINHADQMVRFIDDETILVNDFTMESDRFHTRLDHVLKNSSFKLIHLKNSPNFIQEIKWATYINFVELKNLILVPLYGVPEDNKIMKRFKLFFPKHKIEGIVCPELMKIGGSLNRLIWNIKK